MLLYLMCYVTAALRCYIHRMFLSGHISLRKGAVNRKMVNALHLPPLPRRHLTPPPLSASRVKIAPEMNSGDLLECERRNQ